jgi:hypothetical protein
MKRPLSPVMHGTLLRCLIQSEFRQEGGEALSNGTADATLVSMCGIGTVDSATSCHAAPG